MKNPKDKPQGQGQNNQGTNAPKNKVEKKTGKVKPGTKNNNGRQRPNESRDKEIDNPHKPFGGKDQNEYERPDKEIPDRDHPHTLPVINAD